MADRHAINYRLVAVQVGDALKYATSVNEINRIGEAVLRITRETFPNDAITSVRARTIHDWILSLARNSLTPEERDSRLIQFCRELTPTDAWPRLVTLLAEAGITTMLLNRDNYLVFIAREFHEAIIRHAQKLFLQGNYFHAVFEVAKAYNKTVKEKAQSTDDGQTLMLKVWGWDKGCLKITACQTDTDKGVQDGVKFLSAGLMGAVRNPTAHEPALGWPISLQDCLDILSFISFLFRQLDKAVYFQS